MGFTASSTAVCGISLVRASLGGALLGWMGCPNTVLKGRAHLQQEEGTPKTWQGQVSDI